MNEKWIVWSRRAWAYILAALTIVAGIDAAALDLVFPHVAVLFGLEPTALGGVRSKLLAAAPLAAFALAWWSRSRPDFASLRAVPPTVSRLLGR